MRSEGCPREVQGRSWCPGVPWGAPGLDFGPPPAPFWTPFWSIFCDVFAYFFRAISATFFNHIMHRFGVYFWMIFETFSCPNFVTKSNTFQRTSPGAPSHRHRVKKLDFHWTVVQNRGSTFSCQGASRVGFGGQNGAKMDVQIREKITKNVPRKSNRKSTPKVCQT